MVAAEGAVGELLHQPQGDGALRGEQGTRLARLLEHGVVDSVDEPDAQGFAGVDDAAREDQLLRHAQPAYAREPLSAAPAGNDPEVDLRLAELRVSRGVAEVAGERELAAAAESEPVHGGDRRLRHRLE